MVESCSMIIHDSADNRYLVLFVRFFLELCGYSVLETREEYRAGGGGCRFFGIILRKAAGDGVLPEESYGLSIQDGEADLGGLCNILAEDAEDSGVLRRLLDFYGKELFRELYTITDLYASRKVDYSGEERLQRAVDVVMAKCKEWKAQMQGEKAGWRAFYAYLYLVNKANEGFYKLRQYPYRLYHRLEEEVAVLKSLRQSEQVLLLEADIMRNAQRDYRICHDAYAALEKAQSYGVQYHAHYVLGEMELDRAEEEFRKTGQYDENPWQVRMKLQEPAMAHFARCLEIKPDAFQALFKLEVYLERRGLSDSNDMKKAWKYAEDLEKSISGILTEERTTLEFEYLYKAFLRKGCVLGHLQEYRQALEEYEKAELIWKKLPEWDLFGKIYGQGGVEEVLGFLNRKYVDRMKVIERNREELMKKLGESTKLQS